MTFREADGGAADAARCAVSSAPAARRRPSAGRSSAGRTSSTSTAHARRAAPAARRGRGSAVPPQPSQVLTPAPAPRQGVAQAPGGQAVHRASDQPRLPGRRSARGAPHLRRDQRPQHRDRSGRAGHRSTSSLRDVPWDQALDIILRANKLGYSRRRHDRARRAADGAGRRRRSSAAQLAEQQALAGELRVMTATLSYATADQVRPLLLKSALSQRGTIEVDARSNTLIISRPAGGARQGATALIATLDKPQPQVEIEARIVITNKSFRREIGAQLGLGGEMSPRLGNTTPLAFPNSVQVGGRTGAAQADRRRAQRRQSGRAGRDLGARPGARRGQRRLQPRRRADGARERRQAARHLDAARVDAEQRRSRDRAGHADSDSDGRQQHRHRHLQGRRADAARHAADHRGQHRDHEDRARERAGRLRPQRQRHSAHRHAARQHDRAGRRRRRPRSSAASTSARRKPGRAARRCCTGCRCSAGCSGTT